MTKHFYYRLWEIIPGLVSWLVLLLLVILSFFAPVLTASIILIYVCYWLVRVVMMAFFLILGYRRFCKEIKIDWLAKLKTEFPDIWRDLYHLVIIPTYKEDISILRRTIEAIKDSNYPTDRLIVVVTFEQRDNVLAPKYIPELTGEYKNSFYAFLTTRHPQNITGEIKGKGPNITWAARQAKKFLDKSQLKYENIITTTLDADNIVDRNYFANLSWAFLNEANPDHCSFQPLPMFFNNIWRVPLPVKITALGSTFWQMIQSIRPHFLRNFSSHAQSFRALVETDFWSVTSIVEDGHQYWRSYFKFKGDHKVVPIFVPIYMDAVQGESIWSAFKAQYLQRRRWFWGVSDLPYVFVNSLVDRSISFVYKWLQFLRLWESHFNLATQSFILLIGWLPLTLHPELRSTVFGYNFPIVYKVLLVSTTVGLVVTMAITILIVPPRPGKKRYYYLNIIKELILAPVFLPISAIFFSALPSLDSQTRQLLNKPIAVFNVTAKKL